MKKKSKTLALELAATALPKHRLLLHRKHVLGELPLATALPTSVAAPSQKARTGNAWARPSVANEVPHPRRYVL